MRLGKPRRIVSLNMCVDELVLRLADPQSIASVTWLSRDPTNSNVAALAARIPINHGLAEEIIPLKPDLVIAGVYTARTAVAMLKRVGIPVAEIDVPESLDDVRRQIREVAALVGERDKGEAIIARHGRRPGIAAAGRALGQAAGDRAQSERRDGGKGNAGRRDHDPRRAHERRRRARPSTITGRSHWRPWWRTRSTC